MSITLFLFLILVSPLPFITFHYTIYFTYLFCLQSLSLQQILNSMRVQILWIQKQIQYLLHKIIIGLKQLAYVYKVPSTMLGLLQIIYTLKFSLQNGKVCSQMGLPKSCSQMGLYVELALPFTTCLGILVCGSMLYTQTEPRIVPGTHSDT